MGITVTTMTQVSKLIRDFPEKSLRTAKLIGNFTPADQEWHDIRAKGISGTDVGTILGVNPFASAYSLWCQKTGRITNEVPQNQRMRLGQLLERPLLEMFAESNPHLEVYTAGTFHKEGDPWMIANPDALAFDGDKLYIVEVKTSRKYWDEIPPHYVAQVLHYADVFSADGIKIVALTGGDYREYEVPFEEEMGIAQREAALTFWNMVQEDHEPDWDGAEATYEAVRSMASTEISEESIELGDLGIHLSNAFNRHKAAEEELRQVKSATLAQMGEAKYGMCSEGGEPLLVAVKRSRAGGRPWLEVKG